MARTLDLFGARPRRPRHWLMHVHDADLSNDCEGAAGAVIYKCIRCGHETGWVDIRTVSESKRGIPCPDCNEGENNG